jgi:DNA-binding LacI/PurR family transcriptional regulator
MSVENNQRPFLYQRLYDYVLDEVRAGRLSTGDRVPSEMELAQLFGVSRITSKKALQTLNRDGVVERIVGKGSFVAAQLPALERLSSPDAAPRARRPGRSCIGFVLPAFSPAFEIGLLEGVEARAAELGMNLIVRRTHGRQDVEEQVIDSLMNSELVDGLIVFAVNGEYHNRSLLRLVLDRVPLVLADRALNGIAACAVTTDNHAAALELTRTLLAMGHKHLAFVSAPVNNTTSLEDRLEGFRSAFAHRGLSETQHILTTLRSTPNMPGVSGDTDADRRAIAQLLDEHPEITAFVAAEYQFAVLVHEVLASVGRLHRRTIACFDMPDLPFAPYDFLHVRQDERAMGRLAVDLLVAQVENDAVPPVSTAPYAIVGLRRTGSGSAQD